MSDLYRDPDACPDCGGPKRVYMGGGMWDDCPCDWEEDATSVADEFGWDEEATLQPTTSENNHA